MFCIFGIFFFVSIGIIVNLCFLIWLAGLIHPFHFSLMGRMLPFLAIILFITLLRMLLLIFLIAHINLFRLLRKLLPTIALKK